MYFNIYSVLVLVPRCRLVASLAAALAGSSGLTEPRRQGRYTTIVDGMGGCDGDAKAWNFRKMQKYQYLDCIDGRSWRLRKPAGPAAFDDL